MREDATMLLGYFDGPSEMHQRMAEHDWAATPLGPVTVWPRSLTSVVKTLLASRYPMVLTWGPHFLQFYNDAYSKLIGDKHPAALGQDIRVTLAEGWATLGPMIAEVMTSGVANWNPALLLLLERFGYREEAYFDVSHAPAEDDTGLVVGMLAVCSEVTQQVMSERRMRLLHELGRSTSEARSVEAGCRNIATALAGHPLDIPFALLYLRHGEQLILYESVGLPANTLASPVAVDLGSDSPAVWPFRDVMTNETVQIADVSSHTTVYGGPWHEPVQTALVMPLAGAGQLNSLGVLIAGVSPNRALDAEYRSFYDLLAGQVSTSIRNARAYEEERQRAEALAHLDRTKTEFFSNVSHEFRTPLTLLLGPLEQLLAQQQQLAPNVREHLEMAHRNALRLLKLVNTLLEFTRDEANRAEVWYESVDLATITASIASGFRSAIEQAGLAFVVDTPPLPEPVYVDQDMWEKIVLNLLSNAFKFTQRGQITVQQHVVGEYVDLTVTDTGCGIPAAEIAQVFKRFHRVAGTSGRTHEGTGIGLALVEQLARLHGGTVQVTSTEGRGSTFTVSIPRGHAHLPAESISPQGRSFSQRRDVFTEEVLRWLPDDHTWLPEQSEPTPGTTDVPLAISQTHASTTSADGRPCVLVADDNADMRAYIRSLLNDRYEVIAVSDGMTALTAAHTFMPDLILTDVMMPQLDGLGVLAQLRADHRTRPIPVILLSARAGEEALAAGIETGADDYLTKPFAARELLARVATHLDLARMRREAGEEHARRRAAEELVRERDQFLALAAHELKTPLTSVVGYLDLFMHRVEREGGLDPRHQRSFEVITRQIERLNRLVAVLLDLARLEQGQFVLDQQVIDLNTLVQRVVNDIQPGLTQHMVDVQLGATPLLVWGDALRLEQALQNLLSNATKYSPGGSMISVSTSRHGDTACIAVRDQGIGIPDEVQAQIFQRFYRATHDSSQIISGLGIGLYVVKEIVTRHGGKVDVISQEGSGSTFTIGLPLFTKQIDWDR